MFKHLNFHFPNGRQLKSCPELLPVKYIITLQEQIYVKFAEIKQLRVAHVAAGEVFITKKMSKVEPSYYNLAIIINIIRLRLAYPRLQFAGLS